MWSLVLMTVLLVVTPPFAEQNFSEKIKGTGSLSVANFSVPGISGSGLR